NGVDKQSFFLKDDLFNAAMKNVLREIRTSLSRPALANKTTIALQSPNGVVIWVKSDKKNNLCLDVKAYKGHEYVAFTSENCKATARRWTLEGSRLVTTSPANFPYNAAGNTTHACLDCLYETDHCP